MPPIRSAWAPVTAGALALLVAAAPAAAATQPVGIRFAAFGPAQVDALPGDAVEWTNDSPRQHTVTSDTGLFGSTVLATGERFSSSFDQVGAYAYHCALHPAMTGEIDVRAVTLDAVPTAALAPGTRVELTGRTAAPDRPVRIERSTDGTRFATVASATPAPGGAWRATVRAGATGDYRAASATGVSETRRLRVRRLRVGLRRTRRGVAAVVTPADPYGRIVLQAHLRERFGWWPIAFGRLDYVSRAGFRVRRPARVRAVLVDKDGWTPLATSRVVVVRGDRSRGTVATPRVTFLPLPGSPSAQ